MKITNCALDKLSLKQPWEFRQQTNGHCTRAPKSNRYALKIGCQPVEYEGTSAGEIAHTVQQMRTETLTTTSCGVSLWEELRGNQ